MTKEWNDSRLVFMNGIKPVFACSVEIGRVCFDIWIIIGKMKWFAICNICKFTTLAEQRSFYSKSVESLCEIDIFMMSNNKYQFKIKPYGDYRPGSLAQNQLMVSRYGVKKSLYSIYTCHICTCSSLMLVSQIQYSDSCVPWLPESPITKQKKNQGPVMVKAFWCLIILSHTICALS